MRASACAAYIILTWEKFEVLLCAVHFGASLSTIRHKEKMCGGFLMDQASRDLGLWSSESGDSSSRGANGGTFHWAHIALKRGLNDVHEESAASHAAPGFLCG